MYHGGNSSGNRPGNSLLSSQTSQSERNLAVQQSLMEIFDEFTKAVAGELRQAGDEEEHRLNKSA